MTFSEYKGNLIDWIYFFPAEGGLERDARVLLLSDKETEEMFASRLKRRVKRLSLRLEEGQYFDSEPYEASPYAFSGLIGVPAFFSYGKISGSRRGNRFGNTQ